MRWVVGIDEAGYGPNLGPLVQAAVAARLPADDPAGFATHAAHLRRAGRGDGRLVVDDSKRVNVGPHGFAKLERGLAAVGGVAGTLGEWLAAHALPGVLDDLRGEAWFDPAERLPRFAPHPTPVPAVGHIVGVNLVPARPFNRVVAGSDSKATVLAVGLSALLAAADAALPAGEPATVLCDQLGGRRFYGPVLAAAFPEAVIFTEVETADESRYRLEGIGRELQVVVRPRADAGGLTAALASMAAKYLREVCMAQFNRFWQRHAPGLAPTAGYPVDAARFYAAIRPAMAGLGIAAEDVWRCR
jgi:hypothetical protein